LTNEKLLPVVPNIGEKNRDLKFQMASCVGFKSPFITDKGDREVSLLHVIFDLKNVLVGK
jgi:hypothetical protein